jgi:heat shock protein HtpX
MWEAIASNARRSWLLVSLMGVVLIALGGTLGLAIDPQVGGFFGVAAAVALWLVLWATAATAGDNILLGTAKAHEIQKADAPQLWNVVEEMTIASGLAQMPKVYVIDDPTLNAFAVGYRPHKAAVAVTSGLLKRLNRDELQGVIGHELGHIRNLDVRFMTLASVMVGAVVLISQGFLRGMFYSGGGRRSSSRGGGGQGQILLLAAAIVLAIVAPLAAQVLYFACSRRREFLADASAARFTRYPEGLAAALEKISGRTASQPQVNKVLAPLYIVNPLAERAAFGLFSTHPPTTERIRILRSMAGAGYAAYQAAFQQLHAGARCIGARTVDADTAVPIRASAAVPAAEDPIQRARDVGQLLDRVINFVVIPCACGARLKVPPGFRRDSVTCPRCGREHAVPKAQTQPADKPLRYQRRGTGWESFRCTCGHTVQLSPTFSAAQVKCPKCGRSVEINSGA